MSTTTTTTTTTTLSKLQISSKYANIENTSDNYIDLSIPTLNELLRSKVSPKRYFPNHVLPKVYFVHTSGKCCSVVTQDNKKYFVRMDPEFDSDDEKFFLSTVVADS